MLDVNTRAEELCTTWRMNGDDRGGEVRQLRRRMERECGFELEVVRFG